jgi:3-deoxy-D-manno-octulosonic-acid transferase
MIGITYRMATDLAEPLLRRHLAARIATGKEEAERLDERFGVAGLARPAGRLGWLHAASVGETQSLLPLVGALTAREPRLTLLLTTGTLTSARLVAKRRPPAVLHQYLPLDRRAWVERFLDHWRPDFALWVESELWPNLLAAARARGLPMALVNGRMSARSLARWRWAGSLVRPALAGFAVVLAQDEVQATRLAILGARDPQALGNLKFAADPLPADEAELAALSRQVGGRPLWLAASTHPGEEAIMAMAHRQLAEARPGLLTIIAPRHAERGPAIAAELARTGLAVARRSAGEAIEGATQIYLADSMGELGLFYRLAPVALVAGSYRWQGHNPIEPAQLGAAVLSGPQVGSFQAIYDRMIAAGAALIVEEGKLGAAVDQLLADGGAAGERARAFAGREAAGIMQRILLALEPVVGPRGDAAA